MSSYLECICYSCGSFNILLPPSTGVYQPLVDKPMQDGCLTEMSVRSTAKINNTVKSELTSPFQEYFFRAIYHSYSVRDIKRDTEFSFRLSISLALVFTNILHPNLVDPQLPDTRNRVKVNLQICI